MTETNSLRSPIVSVENGNPVPTRFLTAISIIAMFAVNSMSSSGKLNNTTIGELSHKYNVLISPAGYAFGIWGIIYMLIAAFLIYQTLPRTFDSRPINEGLGNLVPVTAAFNIGWLFAWHFQTPSTLWLSLVCMIGLWISLFTIYLRMIRFTPSNSWGDYFCVNLPFTMYLGWINVASVLNTFIVFGIYVTKVTNEQDTERIILISEIAIVCLALINLAVLFYRHDPVLPLVFTWASMAISHKQVDVPIISSTSYVCGMVVGALACVVWFRSVHLNLAGKRLPWDNDSRYVAAPSSDPIISDV